MDDVTGALDPRALDPAVPYLRFDHYDVTVHWNPANPELNVSAYASERGYHRCEANVQLKPTFSQKPYPTHSCPAP